MRFVVVAVLLATVGTAGSEVHVRGAAAEEVDFVPNRHGHSPAIDWVEAMLRAIELHPPAPTATTWRMWVVAAGMFDAYAAYDHTSVAVAGNGLRRPGNEHTEEHRDTAVAYAAHRALSYIFPTEQALFDAVLEMHGGTPGQVPAQGTAAAIGRAAADAVIALRLQDGSNAAGAFGQITSGVYPTLYAPVNSPDPTAPNSLGGPLHDPNRWTPLRVPTGLAPVDPNLPSTYTDQTFLSAHWGSVDGFALTSGDQFRPPAPPLLGDPSPYVDGRGVASTGDASYRSQAAEVLGYSADLTDARKVTAEFWADGPHTWTPPGHWVQIAIGVALRDEHTLGEDVAMYLAVTSALLDAGIAAWDAKRHYDFVRPATAIPHLYAGRTVTAWRGPGLDSGEIDGADWQPYQSSTFVTPPFAEYVSGHSAFSRAAAEVLAASAGSGGFHDGVTLLGRDYDGDGDEDVMGRHVASVGSLGFDQGPDSPVVLTWSTFQEAADEAGISRLYGGIHFQDGDLRGRELGRRVGQQVWEVAQLHIDPRLALVDRIGAVVAGGGLEPSVGDRWIASVERAFESVGDDRPMAACRQLDALGHRAERIDAGLEVVADIRRVAELICADLVR